MSEQSQRAAHVCLVLLELRNRCIAIEHARAVPGDVCSNKNERVLPEVCRCVKLHMHVLLRMST